jgi:hypothetical protein
MQKEMSSFRAVSILPQKSDNYTDVDCEYHQQVDCVVFKIRENEELSAGATPTSESETLLEVSRDKPIAGSEPEPPDERLPGMTLG